MSQERKRIDGILSLLAKYPAETLSGHDATIGAAEQDDCAVIPICPDIDLVVGSDFVRGTGFTLFKRKVISYQDIGYYLVGANVSDIAAMSATPTGATVVLRYKKDLHDNEFQEIMTGVAKACQKFNIPLLGGDTGGYNETVLSASAFGTCPHNKALLRRNGQLGDSLFLTGTVGDAGASLAYFSRAIPQGLTIEKKHEDELAQSWRTLNPAVKQGQLLGNGQIIPISPFS